MSALPSSSLEGGIDLLNRFQWNMAVEQHGSEWRVYGGHKILIRSDSRETVDAFIYGMALVHALLPENFATKLEAFAKDAAS
jgi:hypothetical protein